MNKIILREKATVVRPDSVTAKHVNKLSIVQIANTRTDNNGLVLFHIYFMVGTGTQ